MRLKKPNGLDIFKRFKWEDFPFSEDNSLMEIAENHVEFSQDDQMFAITCPGLLQEFQGRFIGKLSFMSAVSVPRPNGDIDYVQWTQFIMKYKTE